LKQGLAKNERLRQQSVIDSLFVRSCPALLAYGFRFSWQALKPPQESNCVVLFVSSKKKLKRAVDRNRRKRLLRELYRLNKQALVQYANLNNQYFAISINYVGSAELDFNLHTPLFQKAIQKLILELKKNNSNPIHPAH